jgi:tRNA dimethylallyltransferase
MKLSAILIAGPTASGKSALAIELARQHDGVIVNADSMQVYLDLNILTARPSERDLATVPHELYGTVPASTRYSVGAWINDVGPVLDTLRDVGKLPIIVGGTGLYFKALTEGLAAIPDVPSDILAAWRERQKAEGPESLHAILSERDSDMAAQLNPGDGQRIVRALSVLEATGRSLLEWQKEPPEHALLPLDRCDARIMMPERGRLHARINTRLDAMIVAGAVEEVELLLAQDLDPSLPAMKALGVPHFIAVLKGDLSREEAVRRAKAETRQYAKRQMTWFRHQMSGWRVRDL